LGSVSGSGARFERDWTKGSILRNLLLLSWPILVSYIFDEIGPFVDLIWVGRLGAASVAGVGIAGMVVFLLTAATMSLTIGARALVARFVGAGDKAGANHAAMQAFVIGVAYYAVVAPLGIYLAEPIMSAFGVEADVVAEGAAYMRIMFVSTLAQSLWLMAEVTMQASGDAVTPMRIGIIYRTLHVAICPFLVFGWWVFPRLGVSGAAAANAISQSLGLALGLWVLFSGRTRLRLSLRNFRFDLNIIWRMVRIALPNLFMHIQHQVCAIALIWFMTPFGTLAVAGHTLWQRVDMTIMIMGWAVGTSAGVLGAQNLGANQPERAEKTGWLAAAIATAIMFVLTIVVLLWAEAIASIFSPEPDLVKLTGTFLRIAAISYLPMGLNAIFMEFLVSVGDTMMATLLETLQTWGVQLPLAYFLPRLTGLGVYGVRWAMVAGLVVAGIIFTLYFWLGKWKYKKV
jgi:putative MATE family efflux protein